MRSETGRATVFALTSIGMLIAAPIVLLLLACVGAFAAQVLQFMIG